MDVLVVVIVIKFIDSPRGGSCAAISRTGPTTGWSFLVLAAFPSLGHPCDAISIAGAPSGYDPVIAAAVGNFCLPLGSPATPSASPRTPSGTVRCDCCLVGPRFLSALFDSLLRVKSDVCVGAFLVTFSRWKPLRRHKHRRGPLRVRSDALGAVVVHIQVHVVRWSYTHIWDLQVGW